MTGTMEWADLSRLLAHDFHHYTQQLFELETELQTPIHDSLHWSRRFEYPWMLMQLKSADLSSVLDAGSGATAIQFMLARSNIPTTSIDIDQSAVDWVNNKAPKKLWAPVKAEDGVLAITEGPKPQAVAMNLDKLTFPDNTFGTSICISVLEHLPQPKVLPAIRSLLKVSKTNVLITMDVCLHPLAGVVDMMHFNALMEALGIKPAEQPTTALTFEINGNRFGVACLRLSKS